MCSQVGASRRLRLREPDYYRPCYAIRMTTSCLTVAGATAAGMLLGAGILHLLPKLGGSGRRLSDALCRAPALDWVITYFTIAPLVAGPTLAGWRGLGGAVGGQVGGLLLWTFLHELFHREAVRGPRIVTTIDRLTGKWRNYLATWITALATPVLWAVRMAELIVYPALTWLVGLPKYNAADWVNVSRQKFDGLVGHDLIWCLYCDWMTGIWSLGTEMLRHIESFWCPIQFASGAKCRNCAIDFPDVAHGWVPPTGPWPT